MFPVPPQTVTGNIIHHIGIINLPKSIFAKRERLSVFKQHTTTTYGGTAMKFPLSQYSTAEGGKSSLLRSGCLIMGKWFLVLIEQKLQVRAGRRN
jgi:hypothetical protein